MKHITVVMAGILSLGMAGLVVGCAEEVSHKESDHPNILDNGRTHTEETVYRNPDGSYSTERSKTRTSN